MEWDDVEDPDVPAVSYVLKDRLGKIYLAKCVDVADGGLILQVDKAWVREGTFPEEFLDTRFLEEEMGFKIYMVMLPETDELH